MAALLGTGCVADGVDPELGRLEAAMDGATCQAGMNGASGDLAAYWNRRMERVEAEILEKLDAEGRAIFTEVNEAWRRYRVAESKFAEDEFRGGTISPLIYNNRFWGLTEKRALYLEKLVVDWKESGRWEWMGE